MILNDIMENMAMKIEKKKNS